MEFGDRVKDQDGEACLNPREAEALVLLVIQDPEGPRCEANTLLPFPQ